jgi:hypothetical protein
MYTFDWDSEDLFLRAQTFGENKNLYLRFIPKTVFFLSKKRTNLALFYILFTIVLKRLVCAQNNQIFFIEILDELRLFIDKESTPKMLALYLNLL